MTFAGQTDTSRAAAEALAGCVGTIRRRVYDHIFEKGLFGATDEETQRDLGMVQNTQRPRRKELETMLLVVDSGQRRRLTSGRDGIVWIASAFSVRTPIRRTSSDRPGERVLRKALLMAAASCQGGHSDAGALIAEIFDIPFPIRMENLEAAALKDGFDPKTIWPWLYKMRAAREAV